MKKSINLDHPKLKRARQKAIELANQISSSEKISKKLENLLVTALIHKSFIKEARDAHLAIEPNERLEILGDAVIGLVVNEELYKRYPKMPEGDIAKTKAEVVSTNFLADAARRLKLDKSIVLSETEKLLNGNNKQSILEDSFEAVVGAIFLAVGYPRTRKFVINLLGNTISESAKSPGARNYKAILQENCVREFKELPVYDVTYSGPDHNRLYNAKVKIWSHLIGVGTGPSKKAAEQQAAQRALAHFQEIVKKLRPKHQA